MAYSIITDYLTFVLDLYLPPLVISSLIFYCTIFSVINTLTGIFS